MRLLYFFILQCSEGSHPLIGPSPFDLCLSLSQVFSTCNYIYHSSAQLTPQVVELRKIGNVTLSLVEGRHFPTHEPSNTSHTPTSVREIREIH